MYSSPFEDGRANTRIQLEIHNYPDRLLLWVMKLKHFLIKEAFLLLKYSIMSRMWILRCHRDSELALCTWFKLNVLKNQFTRSALLSTILLSFGTCTSRTCYRVKLPLAVINEKQNFCFRLRLICEYSAHGCAGQLHCTTNQCEWQIADSDASKEIIDYDIDQNIGTRGYPFN